MAGMQVAEFDAIVDDVRPRMEEADRVRLGYAGRKRAPGGGHPYGLSHRDRVLLTVVWLRQRMTYDVLGYLFGVSKTTASRTVARVLPLLEPGPPGRQRPPPCGGGFGDRGLGASGPWRGGGSPRLASDSGDDGATPRTC
jgi:hypothetical protein